MLWLRKFVTSTVACSFLVVGTTGVIFRLWFKNHTLEEIHGWVGLWMVVAACLHVVQNGHSMWKHLRNPRVYVMTLPVLAIGAAFALEKEGPPGPNPRRVMKKLIEARASDVARTLGKTLEDVCAKMRHDGLDQCSGEQTVGQLADQNHAQPDRVLGYFAM